MIKFIWDKFLNCTSAKTTEFKLSFSKQTTTSKTYFCNRDLTAEELKNIVIELRKQEVIEENAKKIRNSSGNQF